MKWIIHSKITGSSTAIVEAETEQEARDRYEDGHVVEEDSDFDNDTIVDVKPFEG